MTEMFCFFCSCQQWRCESFKFFSQFTDVELVYEKFSALIISPPPIFNTVTSDLHFKHREI